jgi:Uma2 family endonuclease
MNVQLPVHMDKTAFLAWIQGREERYELVDGRVVMMTGASRTHGIIVLNIAMLLRSRLDPTTVIADFGLDAGPSTLRYPDIMVDRAGGDYTTSDPLLLVEVLSPSSETLDLSDKAVEYLRLPNLAAYVVVAQHEPKAWLWSRTVSGFSAHPTIVAGRDSSIHVPALSIDLPLSQVYAGITFEQT